MSLRSELDTGRSAPAAQGAEGRKRVTLGTLLDLDQLARRDWLRAWMGRMGLANANQAAPHLCVSRTTMERMVYDQGRQTAITDQTMKLAYLLEQYGLQG